MEEEWRCVVAVVASWCALVGVVLGLVWLQCRCRGADVDCCLTVIVCCVICLLLTCYLRRMRRSRRMACSAVGEQTMGRWLLHESVLTCKQVW